MAEVAHSVSIARSARPARPHSGQGERVLRWSVALLGVGIAVWRILLGLAQATEDPVDAAEFVRATAPLEAVALARQALAEQPLDGRGYRVLAESRLDLQGRRILHSWQPRCSMRRAMPRPGSWRHWRLRPPATLPLRCVTSTACCGSRPWRVRPSTHSCARTSRARAGWQRW